MDIFKRKLSFDFGTNQKIIQLISSIDIFKGKWNFTELKENNYLKELRKIATIESIGSSTRIEGSIMTDSEIKVLINDLEINKLTTRDSQEVVGYYEALELIYENFSDIVLNKNYILQLHQILLKHSTKDERHRGIYKNLSNKVVANYPEGVQKVIFNTTEPHLVDLEMNNIIEWSNEQFGLGEIHPLVITALFVYEFLSIHPFQDGNGRLSRILTNLILLKNNYHFIKYVSFEGIIEQRKKEYYEALMECQKNRYSENENIDKWVLFFLDSIYLLIQKLEQKYDVYKQKGGYLNERQKDILEFIEKNQPVKLNDIFKSMPEISVNTLKKDLQYMKSEKIIETIGKNKGTLYISPETNNMK